MGREIKRVALDFDWPLDKVWEGFLVPKKFEGTDCPDCVGGQTHAGWWIQSLSQRISMLGSDIRDQKLGRPMHPWLQNDQYPHGHWEGNSTTYGSNKYVVDRPSEDILDLFVGLSKFVGNEKKPEDFMDLFGGDSYLIYRVLAKAAGLDGEWGEDSFGSCKTCKGEGQLEQYEGQFGERDAWEPQEPPTGDGWQVWETVSEGSPISPVFPDREGLIRWLMSPAYNWGTSRPLTREQAENFTESAWAPTLMFSEATGLINGDQFVSGKDNTDV